MEHNKLCNGSAIRTKQRIYDHPLIMISIITLIGTILRVFRLDFKAVWLDEAVLYQISTGSLADVLLKNSTGNSAPPLFAILLHFVIGINASVFFLRLISCLAGIAAIPVMYLLATKFMSKLAANFVAFIVAIAVSQIQYSQQVREYSLTFLLASLIFLAFWHFISESTWRDASFLAILMSVGVFTQYGLALLVLAVNVIFAIILLNSQQQDKLLIKWIVIQLPVIISCVLIFEISLKGQWASGGFAGTSYLETGYWTGTLASFIILLSINTLTVISFAVEGFLLIVLFLFGVAVCVRRKNRVGLMFFSIPMIATLGMALFRLYPYIGARQDIFLTPMIYILTGIGFEYVLGFKKRQLVVTLILVTLIIDGIHSIYLYYEDMSTENVKPIVDDLASQYRSGDRIYVYYGAVPAFSYYYREGKNAWIIGIASRENSNKYIEQIDALLATKGRVWMVFSHCFFDECSQIITEASKLRETEIIRTATGAVLYLAY